MFFRKNVINIDVFTPLNNGDNNIKIKKDGGEFNIVCKQTTCKYVDYVWFIHAYIKKYEEYKLIAFSTKTFSSLKETQENALAYFNSISYDTIRKFSNKD
jgi:hypothetical protein